MNEIRQVIGRCCVVRGRKKPFCRGDLRAAVRMEEGIRTKECVWSHFLWRIVWANEDAGPMRALRVCGSKLFEFQGDIFSYYNLRGSSDGLEFSLVYVSE